MLPKLYRATMPVISKPITPALSLLCNSINTPPSSPSQTHLHYKQSVQHFIIEVLAAMLKLVQVAQPPPLPSPPLLFTSSGVEEIPKVRGSKVEVMVLNKMYACKIPKTHLEIC